MEGLEENREGLPQPGDPYISLEENSIPNGGRRYEVMQHVSAVWIERVDGVEIIRAKIVKMMYDHKEKCYCLNTREEFIK